MNQDNGNTSLSDIVAAGAMIVRIENETQQALAIQRPRNEAKILADSLKELQLTPDFAKKAYYSIPYKDVHGNLISVEGPSIKAAMALGRRWGNCANGARIVDYLDDRLLVEGVFIDYEANVRTSRTISISKKAWNKVTKQVVPLREDKLNIAIQAGMSKAVRNAIISSLPVWLIDQYIAEAKKMVINTGLPQKKKATQTIHEKVESMAKGLIDKGAPRDAVEKWINMLITTQSESEALASLTGTCNAIEDGHISIDDVFGLPERTPVPPTGQVLNAQELFKKQ